MPDAPTVVLKAKHQRMGAIQEAWIRSDFMGEVANFQDGQASPTTTNNNNDKHLLVLFTHL